MKEFLLKMFSENSDVSEMRVAAILCVLCAMGIAIYGMSKNPIDYSGLSLLCGTFVGSGMAGKVSQKFAESRENKKKSDDT